MRGGSDIKHPMKKTKCRPLNISEGLTIWCQTLGCLPFPFFGCFGSLDSSWVSIFSTTLRSYNFIGWDSQPIQYVAPHPEVDRQRFSCPICFCYWSCEHMFIVAFGGQGQYCFLIQQVSLMVELPEQGRNYDWRPRRELTQGSVTSKGMGFGTRWPELTFRLPQLPAVQP